MSGVQAAPQETRAHTVTPQLVSVQLCSCYRPMFDVQAGGTYLTSAQTIYCIPQDLHGSV